MISSQIEGTQCTLDDIWDPELNTSTNLDVTDVINYVNGVQHALKLREIHAVLMEGVRGEEKIRENFVVPKIGLVRKVVLLKKHDTFHQM